MTMEQSPYRILVAVDFSEQSAQAIEQAFAAAAGRPTAEVHLISVVENTQSELVAIDDRRGSLGDATDHVRDRLAAHGVSALAVFRAGSAAAHSFPVVAHVRVGATADQVVSLAAELGADLIVMGTHGRRGVQRLMMGSVAERTVRLAPCPVLVYRPKNTDALEDMPQLDPPCSNCIEVRARTGGSQWWCDGHASSPESAHTFSHSRRLDNPPAPDAVR